MPLSLRNRHFLKLLDFSREELLFLLELAASLKAAKRGGFEVQRLRGKKHRLIFEKTSTRTRCSFEVAAYDQGAHVTYLDPQLLADGPQGVDEGHRPACWAGCTTASSTAASTRSIVETLAAYAGRAGLERPDRRVPPDPDPGRRADDAASTPTSRIPADLPARSWATPPTTWATRSWWAARCWAWTCASWAPKDRWPDDDARRTQVRGWPAQSGGRLTSPTTRVEGVAGRRLPVHRRVGVDGRAQGGLGGAHRAAHALPGECRR